MQLHDMVEIHHRKIVGGDAAGVERCLHKLTKGIVFFFENACQVSMSIGIRSFFSLLVKGRMDLSIISMIKICSFLKVIVDEVNGRSPE